MLIRLMVVCFVVFVGVVEAGWYMTNTYTDANCASIGMSTGYATDVCLSGGGLSVKYSCSSGQPTMISYSDSSCSRQSGSAPVSSTCIGYGAMVSGMGSAKITCSTSANPPVPPNFAILYTYKDSACTTIYSYVATPNGYCGNTVKYSYPNMLIYSATDCVGTPTSVNLATCRTQQKLVLSDGSTPVAAPVTSPVSLPVSVPVAAPVLAPIQVPVQTPVSLPTPVSSPVSVPSPSSSSSGWYYTTQYTDTTCQSPQSVAGYALNSCISTVSTSVKYTCTNGVVTQRVYSDSACQGAAISTDLPSGCNFGGRIDCTTSSSLPFGSDMVFVYTSTNANCQYPQTFVALKNGGCNLGSKLVYPYYKFYGNEDCTGTLLTELDLSTCNSGQKMVLGGSGSLSPVVSPTQRPKVPTFSPTVAKLQFEGRIKIGNIVLSSISAIDYEKLIQSIIAAIARLLSIDRKYITNLTFNQLTTAVRRRRLASSGNTVETVYNIVAPADYLQDQLNTSSSSSSAIADKVTSTLNQNSGNTFMTSVSANLVSAGASSSVTSAVQSATYEGASTADVTQSSSSSSSSGSDNTLIIAIVIPIVVVVFVVVCIVIYFIRKSSNGEKSAKVNPVPMDHVKTKSVGPAAITPKSMTSIVVGEPLKY